MAFRRGRARFPGVVLEDGVASVVLEDDAGAAAVESLARGRRVVLVVEDVEDLLLEDVGGRTWSFWTVSGRDRVERSGLEFFLSDIGHSPVFGGPGRACTSLGPSVWRLPPSYLLGGGRFFRWIKPIKRTL